jgi:hypothetical protein
MPVGEGHYHHRRDISIVRSASASQVRKVKARKNWVFGNKIDWC